MRAIFSTVFYLQQYFMDPGLTKPLSSHLFCKKPVYLTVTGICQKLTGAEVMSSDQNLAVKQITCKIDESCLTPSPCHTAAAAICFAQPSIGRRPSCRRRAATPPQSSFRLEVSPSSPSLPSAGSRLCEADIRLDWDSIFLVLVSSPSLLDQILKTLLCCGKLFLTQMQFFLSIS